MTKKEAALWAFEKMSPMFPLVRKKDFMKLFLEE
jgi:hypothetical protein